MPEFIKRTFERNLCDRIIPLEFALCTSKGMPFSSRNIVRYFKDGLKRAELPEAIRNHDIWHPFVGYLLL